MKWKYLTDVEEWWPWMSKRRAEKERRITEAAVYQQYQQKLRQQQDEVQRLLKPLLDRLMTIEARQDKSAPFDPIQFTINLSPDIFHFGHEREQQFFAEECGRYVEAKIARILVVYSPRRFR